MSNAITTPTPRQVAQWASQDGKLWDNEEDARTHDLAQLILKEHLSCRLTYASASASTPYLVIRDLVGKFDLVPRQGEETGE